MSFKDVLKDSLVAALRNPGDTSGTLRDFNARRNKRLTNEKLIGQQATILAIVAAKQQEVNARVEQQRQRGHRL